MKEKELNEYIDLLEDLNEYQREKIDLMHRAQNSEGSKKELFTKNILELDVLINEKKVRKEELQNLRRKRFNNER